MPKGIRLIVVFLFAIFALVLVPGASPALSAERFVYLHSIAGPTEVEEGNLWVMTEPEEQPQQLKLWGQNPTMDTRGRLIAYYQNHSIYVADYKAKTVRELFDLGEESELGHPQWVPGHGLLSDGNGNIKYIDYSERYNTEYEIGWVGVQFDPAPFPSGDKVAFYSFTTPSGEPIEDGQILFISNLDGSGLEQVTLPEGLSIQGAPTISPDGSRVAFPAIGEFNEWENVDLVSLPIGGGTPTRLTDISERGLNGFGFAVAPDWLPDGRLLFTEQHYGLELGGYTNELRTVPDTGGPSSLVLPAFINEQGESISGRQPVDWEPLTAESSDRATRLMRLYSPTLKYDSLESFRAVAVNSIFETYGGTEPSESNQLVDGEGNVIQYANLALNPSELRIWLAAQGNEYLTDNVTANESHRLDERNGSYEEDAAPWQEEASYADRNYARAVFSEGRWWLQYWFWSYYNNFNLFGIGDHEGDWEMIQLELGEYGNPLNATYAQHHDDEADSCNFDYLDWTLGMKPNISPVVYVARGTHASYVRPGVLLGGSFLDEAKGDGYVARLRAVEMFQQFGGTIGGDYGREWSLWPGRWGSSLGQGMSPMAPISQGLRFDEPQAFSEQAEGCPREEEGTVQGRVQASSIPVPSRPAVEGEIVGDEVQVRYRVSHQGPERQGIEVAVSAERPVVVPRTGSSKEPEGTLSIPLPNGDGPYTVTAIARNEAGAGSAPVILMLGDHQSKGRSSNVRDRVGSLRPSRSPRFPIPGSVRRELSPRAIKALRQRQKGEERINRKTAKTPAPHVLKAFGEHLCTRVANERLDTRMPRC